MNFKVKMLVAALLVSATQTAAAQHHGASRFFGVELGPATFSPDAKFELSNDSFESATALGIRYGTDMNTSRLYATLNYQSFDPKQDGARGSADIWTLSLNWDYQFAISEGFKLFVGPHAGFNMKAVDIAPPGTELDDEGYEAGYQFGLQAGAGLQFDNAWSAEIGYRYTQEKGFSGSDYNDDGFSSINFPYLAVNFHY